MASEIKVETDRKSHVCKEYFSPSMIVQSRLRLSSTNHKLSVRNSYRLIS